MGETTLGGTARRPFAPAEVRDLAHARRDARRRRAWDEADELLARIEAAGWKVVDRGTDFALEPLVPPDVVADGVVLRGGSASVESLLEAAPTRDVAVIVIGGADGTDRSRQQPIASTIVVAGTVELDPAAGTEVVRLLPSASAGALVAAGLRRAAGSIVVLAWAGAALPERTVAELAAALADPTVACAGTAGARTTDLRRLEAVAAGDADLLLATAIAFRRSDLVARLPIDERLTTPDHAAAWLSLRLREPEDPWTGGTVGRALVVGADLARTEARIAALADDRTARRDRYRLHDRFGGSTELLRGPR